MYVYVMKNKVNLCNKTCKQLSCFRRIVAMFDFLIALNPKKCNVLGLIGIN